MEKEKVGCSQHENQTGFISDGQGVVPSHPYPSKRDKVPSCSFSHSCHLQIGLIEGARKAPEVRQREGEVGRMRWREAGNTGRKMDILTLDENAPATHK